MAMYHGHKPGPTAKVVHPPSHVVPSKQATTGKGLKYTRAGVEERVKRGGGPTKGQARANPSHPAQGSIGRASVR